MRVEEACVAFECRDIVAAELGLDDFDLAQHDRLRAKGQVRHGDAVFENISAAIKSALAKAAQVEHGFAYGFAGNRPGVNADAANGSLAVNDGDLLTHLGSADGGLLPRRAAADHHQVIFIRFHNVFAVPENLSLSHRQQKWD